MIPIDFTAYLRGFDYAERTAMKIQTKELLDLYAAGRAQLIDIRFADEARAWRIGIIRAAWQRVVARRMETAQ